jgi:protein tyrosine/serine phosphatase
MASNTPDIQTILSSPPFVVVEGVVNIRAIGGYATSDSQLVKPLTIFRSGELSRITDAGKRQLRALGIAKVFDFRSEEETAKLEMPSPNIDGVEIIKVPVFTNESFDSTNVEKLWVPSSTCWSENWY